MQQQQHLLISSSSPDHLHDHHLPDACQVTFSSTVQQQQHLAGPVYRKALQKQEAEAARQQRMAPYSHVAEAALGAAAWNTTHSAGGVAPHRPGKSNNVAAVRFTRWQRA